MKFILIFSFILSYGLAYFEDSLTHDFTWSKTSPRFFHEETQNPYNPVLNIALNDELAINCPQISPRSFYVYQVDKTSYENCILPRRAEKRLRQQILQCSSSDVDPALFKQRIVDQSYFGAELLILKKKHDYYFISATRDSSQYECQKLKLHVLGDEETIPQGFEKYSPPSKSKLALASLTEDPNQALLLGVVIGASLILLLVLLALLSFCVYNKIKKQKPKPSIQHMDIVDYRNRTMMPPFQQYQQPFDPMSQGMRYIGQNTIMTTPNYPAHRMTPQYHSVQQSLSYDNGNTECMMFQSKSGGCMLPVQDIGTKGVKNRHSTSGSDTSSPTNNTNNSANQPLLEQRPGAVIDV